MKNRKLICVILAAGKGTRMKSALPKVLHPVAGLPMITHVIRAAETLTPDEIVVVGPGMEDVAAAVAPYKTAVQAETLGTGHAVKAALSAVQTKDSDILVLYGDVPLTPAADLSTLVAKHRKTGAGVTILAMRPENPHGYGRLIVGTDDSVIKIVEELDASATERQVTLCNSGMMIIRGDEAPGWIARIGNKNAKGEYYLTDVLAVARADGAAAAYALGDADDLNGVNDRVQLAGAEKRLQEKLRSEAMRNGVTMVDPSAVYLSVDTALGRDVVIEPNVFFGPGVVIANEVQILANCHLENVSIKTGAVIGPFARIRGGSEIGEKVEIGNFVEVNKSNLGKKTKAKHLNYLGYVTTGQDVNIGAGTLLSNYDGKNKNFTSIQDRAFVGANTTLISPVTVGANAYIAAGSVITDDVPENKLAFGRARQIVRDHTEKTRAFSEKKKG